MTQIDLTFDEILEDLCSPGLPPGRWNVPAHPLTNATSPGPRRHYDHDDRPIYRRRRDSVQDSAGSLRAPR
jgi:hypothetical protein